MARVFRQFVAFGAVGAVGFVVDAGTLYAVRFIGCGLLLGRVISYLAAVTATWALNRRYTFRVRARGGLWAEWLKFVISQTGGAAVNLGVYWWLVSTNATVAAQPVWGVAAGSLAGMVINFMLARTVVFRAT